VQNKDDLMQALLRIDKRRLQDGQWADDEIMNWALP
jgi:hypothetical protein